MPIAHRVDSAARVVVAVGYGVVTDADVFAYQRSVWSRPDVVGYSELIDMSQVTEFETPPTSRVRELAALAVGMDGAATTTRLAILAPGDIAYGLARMYQSHRELHPGSRKDIEVFRSIEEALAYLGLESPVRMPEIP